MAKQKRGRFIVLDGPDGAGKSTQAKLLVERLGQSGVSVKLLREPGGTAAGEGIRALVLEHRGTNLSPLTETFLFQAARAQIVEEVIRPALESGTWIVCDRFALSTLVYQGYAGSVGKNAVNALAKIATAGLKVDLYFVVWVGLETGVSRRSGRAADRMESKGDKFLKRVADGYGKEAKANPKQYIFVDGSKSVNEVQAAIWKKVQKLLSK